VLIFFPDNLPKIVWAPRKFAFSCSFILLRLLYA
jgi:hypothetical protein